MKHLMLAFAAIFLLATTSCNKDNDADKGEKFGEIQFSSDEVELEKSNSGFEKDGEVPCDTEVDYALIYLDGASEATTIEAFVLNGKITTTALKLSVGTHSLDEFVLMGNGEDGIQGTEDDVMIKATANTGSDYAEFTETPLPINFEITDFTKTTTNVEVFCLEGAEYVAFGFNFWTADETTVRQEYFFGDVCVACIEEFELDPDYAGQAEILMDNAAIIKVEVYRNGILMNSADNKDVSGEGVVTVNYPDRDNEVDNFEFKLYAWLPTGDTFGWVYLHSYFTTDDEYILADDNDSDNINEFVIGNCVSGGSEVNLPQYTNLPETVNFSVSTVNGATLGGYFDITLSGLGAGYSLGNETYVGFCVQSDVFITPGIGYTGTVYSSLDPEGAAPNVDLTVEQIKKLHWLINNLGGITDVDDIQNLIWYVTNGATLNANTSALGAEMDSNWGDYNPVPNSDEKYLVILYHNDNTQLQVMDLDVCP